MATPYVEDGYYEDGYTADGIYIDWSNRIEYYDQGNSTVVAEGGIINVPKNYMLLVQSSPTEVRELDIDKFRLDLKALEASGEGVPFLDTHSHNEPVTVGGVTLARVVQIINGYTITFEDDQYAVNLVGANSNIGDVVNVNQVSVRSSNSAGLTYSKEIEDQSFLDGRIWIDVDQGSPGTQFPRGTAPNPVNNYEDAEGIAENRGFTHRFWLDGLVTLVPHGSGPEYADWLGSSPVTATLVLAGVDTTKYILRRLTVTGVGNGNFSLQDGVIANMDNYVGDASNSGIGGYVRLPTGPSQTELYTFHKCFSIVPGTGTPLLDCNDGTDLNIQFRGYHGGIEIRNYSSPDNNMSIDLDSGHVVLDSTVTDGTIVIRGTGHVTDNSNGATVITKGLSPVWTEAEKDATLVALTSIADVLALLQKYEENRSVIDKVNNTLTIYDDDDVTPILTFQLLDSTGTPSTDEVAERVPQ